MCIAWFMLDCILSGFSRKIFIRNSNIQLHVKSSSGSLVDNVDGRTYITKLIGESAVFAKTPVSHTSCVLLLHYRQIC